MTRREPAPRLSRVTGGERIEISDLLMDVGADGQRHTVTKESVVARCLAAGDPWAARIVERLPVADGALPEDFVDRLLVGVHTEIQRLSEEFRHGARMWTLVEPLVRTLRLIGHPPPYRVVDVGCGTGYMVRWLAGQVAEADVVFAGVDLNPALVGRARDLAGAEGLPCRFEVGDAFALDEPADIFISTGVLHHLRGDALGRFFSAQASSPARAFVHSDFQPSPWAGAGAWLFHRTRMRLALSRHDGIRSAQRAYPPEVLAACANRDAPDFMTWFSGRRVRGTPLPCVLSNVVGVRRDLADAALASYGALSSRLEATA